MRDKGLVLAEISESLDTFCYGKYTKWASTPPPKERQDCTVTARPLPLPDSLGCPPETIVWDNGEE